MYLILVTHSSKPVMGEVRGTEGWRIMNFIFLSTLKSYLRINNDILYYLCIAEFDPTLLELLGKLLQLLQLDILICGQIKPRHHVLVPAQRREVSKCRLWYSVGGRRERGRWAGGRRKVRP
jgi:hypothetical protein